MIERDYIKTAAILAQRSKGGDKPVTRSEFVGQWTHRLHNVAAAVWDEVQKASLTPTPAAVVTVQRSMGQAGAIHTGKVATLEGGVRQHRYLYEGRVALLEISPDAACRMFLEVGSLNDLPSVD